MGYRSLDGRFVKATSQRLERRIRARFPDRNLASVAADVSLMVEEIITNLEVQQRRFRWGRIISVAVIVALLVAVVAAVVVLLKAAGAGLGDATGWPSFFESVINDLVFAGIAIYFTWMWPERLQQRAALDSLHQLRSLAHVIDMHQLTKDPERLRPDFVATEASYDQDMTAQQLSYYLDYCSELLSCVGKIGALLGEHTSDSKVLAAIEGIEDLTTGMSRKIWQKIALLPQNR